MSARRDALSGGRLVGVVALGLFAMCAVIAVLAGAGEAGLRLQIRATARTSLVLFAVVFTASSLRRLWRTPATAWLLRQRRYLGLSFAVSHALHGVAIALLSLLLGDAFQISPVTAIFGGGAYGMIALMAATSSDRAVAWLGLRRWRLLHRVGVYWIWVIFANSYTARGVESLVRGHESPLYIVPALIVWAALGLRVWVALRERRPRAAAAPA